ncbi:MAG: hypothetical protein Q4B23_06680 [Helcococcus sp.]|nr:hypothetical protein [Helcococcus sp.]
MGGGNFGGFKNTKGAKNDYEMPNYSKSKTPKEKFLNYSLEYNNPNSIGKAEAYEKALGYTKKNASSLIEQIHNSVTKGKSKPVSISSNQFGTKYKYEIPVKGPNGKTKIVVAVYQIDKNSNTPTYY